MLWREVLIHKRLTIILNDKPLSEETMGHLKILQEAIDQNKHSLVSSYAKMEKNSEIQMLVDGVCESPNTDMGSYWMSFIDMSDILLQNVHACHVGKFEEYLSSTRDMPSGLLA